MLMLPRLLLLLCRPITTILYITFYCGRWCFAFYPIESESKYCKYLSEYIHRMDGRWRFVCTQSYTAHTTQYSQCYTVCGQNLSWRVSSLRVCSLLLPLMLQNKLGNDSKWVEISIGYSHFLLYTRDKYFRTSILFFLVR